MLCLLLLTTGTRAQWKLDASVREWVQQDLRQGGSQPFYDLGTYLEYTNGIAHLGLGLLGAKSRHAVVDRAIESAISYGFALGGGFVLKRLVARPRPDGTGADSFPSGHSIISFTGAELVRMDYDWGWGAGAYAGALIVAGDRSYGDRHWLTDVLAGAAWGVLSAHIGGWLLSPVKQLFRIPEIEWDGLGTRKAQLAVTPVVDPMSGTCCAGLNLMF